MAHRPLSARSVMASMLLGTDPPVLRSFALVRAGEVFGMAEGTVRTALSRMASSGEVIRHVDGSYELAGDLVARQARQRVSREAATHQWSGNWEMWVVGSGSRSSAERALLRKSARVLNLAEFRDGVWMRPDNLDRQRFPSARAIFEAQATSMTTQPHRDDELPPKLWDLDAWNQGAEDLRREMAGLSPELRSGEVDALRPGFIVSAAVHRQFNADPMLPNELAPSDWQAHRLRLDFDQFETEYRSLLSSWFREAKQR